MVASAPIIAFLGFFSQLPCTILFPSHWMFSHITKIEAMDSGESELYLVAMTIINPWKEYGSTGD